MIYLLKAYDLFVNKKLMPVYIIDVLLIPAIYLFLIQYTENYSMYFILILAGVFIFEAILDYYSFAGISSARNHTMSFVRASYAGSGLVVGAVRGELLVRFARVIMIWSACTTINFLYLPSFAPAVSVELLCVLLVYFSVMNFAFLVSRRFGMTINTYMIITMGILQGSVFITATMTVCLSGIIEAATEAANTGTGNMTIKEIAIAEIICGVIAVLMTAGSVIILSRSTRKGYEGGFRDYA